MNGLVVTGLLGLGGVIGGLIGYFGRGWIDEHFRKRGWKDEARRSDLEEQRELLIDFLGQPEAHFRWLHTVPPEGLDEGEPPAHEKVQQIAGWIYENKPRYPDRIRGELQLILNAAYGLLQPGSTMYEWARGDVGRQAIREAWGELEAYQKELREQLTGEPLEA